MTHSQGYAVISPEVENITVLFVFLAEVFLIYFSAMDMKTPVHTISSIFRFKLVYRWSVEAWACRVPCSVAHVVDEVNQASSIVFNSIPNSIHAFSPIFAGMEMS